MTQVLTSDIPQMTDDMLAGIAMQNAMQANGFEIPMEEVLDLPTTQFKMYCDQMRDRSTKYNRQGSFYEMLNQAGWMHRNREAVIMTGDAEFDGKLQAYLDLGKYIATGKLPS